MIRAKFKCNFIGESLNADSSKYGERIVLNAVYSPDENDVNYTWSKYTPSGMLDFFVTNPAVWDQFKLGSEYYIDFQNAEEVDNEKS